MSDFVMKLFVVSSEDSMFAKLISSSSVCPHFATDFEVLSIGTQLMGAMIPTTSRTLQWVFLFLLNRPGLLEKVRAEILNQGEVTLKCKVTNVYLNAVIYETLRFITTTPISVPRAPAEDVNDGKVFIPKGTPVLGKSSFLNLAFSKRFFETIVRILTCLEADNYYGFEVDPKLSVKKFETH